jgi:NAD(P)-dependent dehydrogenase (short-subunit alcohol dehydrogenase family)
MIQNEFLNKRVIVTGGTKGIGAAIVKRFADEGAIVVTSARAKSVDLPKDVHFIAADLNTSEGVTQFADEALGILGSVDILINNAGGSLPFLEGPLSIPDDAWLEALQLNFLAAVRLDHILIPRMLEQGHGSIIQIVSNSASRPIPVLLHYSSAKAALLNYAKGLATDLASKGIRVNSVSPGMTLTAAVDGVINTIAENTGKSKDEATHMLIEMEKIPLGQAATPADIANAVAFLGSRESSHIVGANIVVDGGTLLEV